jgi:hypothetical protein
MFLYCWRAGLKGPDPRTCVMGSALCLPTSIFQGCNTLSARTLEKGVGVLEKNGYVQYLSVRNNSPS